MPATVRTQLKPPVTLKCLNCNEEFSDLYYLKVHNEIHNSDNKEDDKNYESQKNKQLKSGDVNSSECDETSEQAIDNDFSEQTNAKEIEIKLEITNLVTLKDELNCVLDNNSDNEQIKEKANEEKNHKNFESFGKTPESVENIEQDSIVQNNEQLANDSDFIGQISLKSFNADYEAKTTVDRFESNENFNIELSKTNEDVLMVNNKDEENDLAKVMLLETDA